MSWFANNPLLAFPLAALAIFMVVFFAVTLRTVLSSKESYAAIERLALDAEPRATCAEKEAQGRD